MIAENSNSNSNSNVLNNVINTQSTTRLIVTFSIPPQFANMWQEWCSIAKREAGPRGRSETFVKMMSEYVKRHGVGNPQLKISVYAKPEEPQPMRVLCNFLDGAVSGGQVHCRRAGMWVPGVRCYSCERNELRKR